MTGQQLEGIAIIAFAGVVAVAGIAIEVGSVAAVAGIAAFFVAITGLARSRPS